MIGDVVFFKRTNSLISRMIAKITSGEYTHVGLIVAYDEMTGVATIIESNRFIKTKLTRIKIESNHTVYTTGSKTKKLQDDIIKYAYQELGTEYDYLQIVGLFISLMLKGKRYATFNSANKLICSELIDLSYYKSGVKRKHSLNIGNITPQELLEVYDFKREV